MTKQDQKSSGLMALLVGNALAGALVGALVSVALLFTDTWGLSTLIGGDTAPALSAFVFIAYGVAMFSTLMVVTAIILSGSD